MVIVDLLVAVVIAILVNRGPKPMAGVVLVKSGQPYLSGVELLGVVVKLWPVQPIDDATDIGEARIGWFVGWVASWYELNQFCLLLAESTSFDGSAMGFPETG